VGLLARAGRLLRPLRPHQFDITLVSLLLVMHLLGFGQSPGVGVGASLLAAVPILALLVRRAAPALVPVAFLVAGALSIGLGMPDASSASAVVVVVAGAYSAGAYLPPGRGLATLGLWWSVLLVDFVGGREEGGFSDYMFAGLILVCAFVPGAVARRLRAQAESARAALETAAGERTAAAEAVTAERARIARELHDVVAHAVSIMVVQAAAADEVLEGDPARAHAALAAVQRAGRSAITEMARMLDLLRGTGPGDDLAPLPTLDVLPQLADEARLAGAEVVLDRCTVPPLSPAIELCAVRVVQEALTNAAKHAHNPRVRVAVGTADDMLDVVVEDDGGSGPAPASAGTGHGLVGLRERVEVFNGTFDAASRDGGGFRVHATLPVQATP
jgi:signal transduction histidine kinase